MSRTLRTPRAFLDDPITPLTVYAAVLVLLATAALALLPLAGYTLGTPWLVIVLAITAAAAERGTVRLSARIEVSVGLLPTLFAAVVLGPMAALAGSAASIFGVLGPPQAGPLPLLT